jgi:hypothetical protein
VSGANGCNAQIGWFENPYKCPQKGCGSPASGDAWQYHVMIAEAMPRVPPDNIGEKIMTMLAVDMDDDDDTDLFYTDRNSISYLKNLGSDPRQWSNWERVRIESSRDRFMFSDVTDFNDDGKLDIVTITRQASQVKVIWFENLNNTGNPVTPENSSVKPGYATPYEANRTDSEFSSFGKAVKVAKIDDDDLPDLVLSFVKADGKYGIAALINDGDLKNIENWSAIGITGLQPRQPRQVTPPDYDAGDGIKFDDILIVDVDGDDDLDILSTEEEDGTESKEKRNPGLGVLWYINPTQP